MNIKIAVFILMFFSAGPLTVYAQEVDLATKTPSRGIQSGTLELNNIIDSQKFMDILKKNIDVPKIENILRKNSGQPRPAGGGITARIIIDFIKDALAELLHSIGGLVYNLMHILGLEKYLRYLPRF